MTPCENCSNCGAHNSPTPPVVAPPQKGKIIIVGNLNVGKTTLFSHLTGSEGNPANVPGSTVSLQAARIRRSELVLYDTPGTYSVFSKNDDEVASRDALLMQLNPDEFLGILLIADAKNLKRSLALCLQYLEYGLPMLMVINMIDEAAPRGIQIDTAKLSEILGLDVCTTVAPEGLGVSEIYSLIPLMKIPKKILTYPHRIEQFIELTEKLLQTSSISPRILGVLLLANDRGVEGYIKREFGPGMLGQLKDLAEDFRRDDQEQLTMTLVNFYLKKSEQIIGTVVTLEPPPAHPFARTLGDWCSQPSTGIPIALVILFAMYLIVGTFGATYLVDLINNTLFQGLLIPLVVKFVQPIPSVFIRDLIVDPAYGVLPTGVFLAIGIVAPVMFCFYTAFGLLEDSGYLPRLSILLDRIFRMMGLNGKGVVPLVMGFSCVTMAILTTRILDTKKEKYIASFLLFLCAPCAPMIAVMLTILDKMPKFATIAVFGLILLQMFVAGFLANKLLPGSRAPLLLEIPVMRIPKPLLLLKSATRKTYFFMKEAVPVFILASVVVFLFQRVGGLKALEDFLKPLTSTLLGLPENSVQVFIKTIVRRESGATELLNLSSGYTNLQLVVSLLVMTFMIPCLNATLALYKERGGKVALAIAGGVMVWAVALGGVVNHLCHWLGITFS
ncbi:MAG: ferrous iron transporter B [Candidatus Riflebacteria bacterium]|nr:ferrous iron transporter B [Candidatus Riflebacteria bacterium]